MSSEVYYVHNLVHGIVLQEQWILPIRDVLFHKLFETLRTQGLKKKQCRLGDLPSV